MNSAEPPSVQATAGLNPSRGSVWTVLLVFLRLGLTSFGGPAAHLGYFRAEFVERRRWLDDKRYSDLVALCQFLPGPTSSQVGMALGLYRAGLGGAIAAWLGFTLPSAVLLIALAIGLSHGSTPALTGALQGLKLVAVAVVAQAVWAMAKTLCPDRLRAGIAIAAALGVLVLPTAAGQVLVIGLGGLLGRWALPTALNEALPQAPQCHPGIGKRVAAAALGLFGLLLIGLPLLAANANAPALSVLNHFYQAGALVFGGGHVVLPLLQTAVVSSGWVANDVFLAGYGAAQAVPGPLFSFAAYLGAAMPQPFGGWLGGFAVLLAIFLPAFLLVIGVLPYWENLRQRAGVQRAMAGVNAAVVGLLLAALYDPVWTSAIHSRIDFALALAAFGLLVFARLSPLLLVVLAASLGGLLWV